MKNQLIIIFFDRPCSQIDEEIEDDDETSSSSLGGSGGNSGLEDDSEMTYVNTLETKQVRRQKSGHVNPFFSKISAV